MQPRLSLERLRPALPSIGWGRVSGGLFGSQTKSPRTLAPMFDGPGLATLSKSSQLKLPGAVWPDWSV
jgi:hypothetical protein